MNVAIDRWIADLSDEQGRRFARIAARWPEADTIFALVVGAVCMIWLREPGAEEFDRPVSLDRAGYVLDGPRRGEFLGWIVDLACEQGFDLSEAIALVEVSRDRDASTNRARSSTLR